MSDPYDESETESQPASGWVYVAPMNVQPAIGGVQIPDELFEVGILDPEGRAYWAYERVTGVLVVANADLEDDDYHTVDSRKIYDDGRVRIPGEFFPPGHDARPHEVARAVHENAYVRRDERRHFVYRVGMDEGETRSCYLLTDLEVQNRLSGPDDWVGSFDSKPQFF